MSTTATPFAPGVSPAQRLEVLFGEMAELIGQRNAIDGRLVEMVAEIERDELCGMTGARSLSALVAWKTGVTPPQRRHHGGGRAAPRRVPSLRRTDLL